MYSVKQINEKQIMSLNVSKYGPDSGRSTVRYIHIDTRLVFGLYQIIQDGMVSYIKQEMCPEDKDATASEMPEVGNLVYTAQ